MKLTNKIKSLDDLQLNVWYFYKSIYGDIYRLQFLGICNEADACIKVNYKSYDTYDFSYSRIFSDTIFYLENLNNGATLLSEIDV